MDLATLLGEKFVAAKHAARGGRYQILLGAGASFGAKNSTGHDLPGAGDLVKVLATQYPTAHIDDSTPLQRAYQRATKASSNEDVWHFAKKLYGRANHQEWFTLLTGFPWRRAWTLNIDDAFENAYKKSARALTSSLKTLSFTDEYTETSGLEIVHLHGHILGQAPLPLVFSMAEYQAAAEAHGVWHRVLRGILSSEPFIIIGAKILNDPDIEALILSSKPAHEAPSIIVDPLIDAGNKWELEQSGYIVAQCTGEEFTKSWAEGFSMSGEALENLYRSEGVNIPQMIHLRLDQVSPNSKSHDFLGGSEPTWNDACAGKIASFEWMREVETHFRRWKNEKAHGVYVRVLYADRLAGASAGLFSVARTALNNSTSVLWFDRSVRFDPDQVLDFCQGKGPVLLIVDGVSDFSADVDKLASLADDDAEVLLYILVTDRPGRYLRIEDQLRGTYEKHASTVALKRSKQDARAISRLLEGFGRLGYLEEKTFDERVDRFVNRDIFSSMGEVEHSSGFRARLDHEVTALGKEWHRDLLFLLSLASFDNSIVGVTEASFALDVPPIHILDDVSGDSHLSALVEASEDALHPRQRRRGLASLVAVGRNYDFLERLTRMLANLAPLATNAGLKNRNRSAVLTGHLMNAKQLRQVFPKGDLVSFFDALQESFGGWNARYWEQRAIEAKMRSDWGPAESYAERAVSLNDDTFTRTTLGTILLNKSASLAHEGDQAWVSYYERGYAELSDAIGRGSRNRVTALAYLEATMKILEVIKSRQDRNLQTSGSSTTVIEDWQTVYAIMRIGLVASEGFTSTSRAEQLSARFTKLGFGTVSSPLSDAEGMDRKRSGNEGDPSSQGKTVTTPDSTSHYAEGVVKWFSPAKGYGFIAPDDGSTDSFFHFSQVISGGHRSLQEKQRVAYVVTRGPKGPVAKKVRIL